MFRLACQLSIYIILLSITRSPQKSELTKHPVKKVRETQFACAQ